LSADAPDTEGAASADDLIDGASAALLQGRANDAVHLLQQAEALWNLDAEIQRRLEIAYRRAGRELEAAAAHIAADAFEHNNPVLLYNLATGYFQHGHHAAEKWYRLALRMDPDMAAAHQNLAALLRNRGEWREADQHVELAYRNQWVFGEYANQPVARIMMACAGGLGNVPTDSLLPADRFTLIKCMIDYQREGDAALPVCDVVFNAVGDPDCKTASSPALRRFLEASSLPLLNSPERVLATRRDRLAATLASLEHVLVPRVVRLESTAADAEGKETLAASLASGSLIMRCAESHGGDSVLLVSDAPTLERWLSNTRSTRAPRAIYATQFVDSRDADQHYRKYRVIFIGGRPLPYHLAISSNWMVHYFSAGMTGAAWKLAEERRFLEKPEEALGSAAWEAIAAIGARLGLDYCGIDFTLHQGQILVFEANATMIIHHERPDGNLAHKNPYVDAIVAAFEQLVIKKGESRGTPPMPQMLRAT
jgi:glutathione synthase/RimK-type ligase-like ATP-grasp enzyme